MPFAPRRTEFSDLDSQRPVSSKTASPIQGSILIFFERLRDVATTECRQHRAKNDWDKHEPC
jgi:hypothetical protein